MKIYANNNLSSEPLDRFVGKDLWFALWHTAEEHLGWYRILYVEDSCYFYVFVDDSTLSFLIEDYDLDDRATFVDNLLLHPYGRRMEGFNQIYKKYYSSEVLTTAELFHLEDSEVPQ